MTFSEFLAPLKRKKYLFILLWMVFSILLFLGSKLLPKIEKTTIFFTVKPVASADKSFVNDGVESAERIAEMIAGWAKDPNFLRTIQETAQTNIPKLKKKISARKQNRLNVFWTLKLSGKEKDASEKLAQGLSLSLSKTINRLNEGSAVPLQITDPQIFTEILEIPVEWIWAVVFVLAIFFAGFTIYGLEVGQGRVSYLEQIREIFPHSPMFQVIGKLAEHDQKQLDLFVQSFENPRLISTFATAGKYLEIVDPLALSETEIPILIVKMGETTLKELENNLAIFGEEVGIIVFEK